MPRAILTTVGTSLLSNAKPELKLERDPNPQELANYLRQTTAEKACAETNSLSRLLEAGDQIVFIHSETTEGKLCAASLQKHFENMPADYRADLREVPNLTYKGSRFKMRGLRSLVAILCELIRQERSAGREVAINATGGFKAEVAYATLVGLLFDVPVYYIHEAFQEIIEMPALPIGWDYGLIADHEDFFEWINADYRTTEEVDKRLRGLPGDAKLLLTEEDGYCFLSPAGEAFYEAYRSILKSPSSVEIKLSASAQQTYASLPQTLQRRFDKIFEKLQHPQLCRSGAAQVRNCDVLVYPRGHRDERVFFYEDDDGNIRVCEITRHSDSSYEKSIARGVRRSEYENVEFYQWQE